MQTLVSSAPHSLSQAPLLLETLLGLQGAPAPHLPLGKPSPEPAGSSVVSPSELPAALPESGVEPRTAPHSILRPSSMGPCLLHLSLCLSHGHRWISHITQHSAGAQQTLIA